MKARSLTAADVVTLVPPDSWRGAGGCCGELRLGTWGGGTGGARTASPGGNTWRRTVTGQRQGKAGGYSSGIACGHDPCLERGDPVLLPD